MQESKKGQNDPFCVKFKYKIMKKMHCIRTLTMIQFSRMYSEGS